MKKLLISVVAVLAATGMAMGAGFSIPGAAAQPGETVLVSIDGIGGEAIAGVNLYVEVEAPLEIVDITLAGGLFENNTTGLIKDVFGAGTVPAPQYAIGQTTTQSGTVQLPGTLAHFSILVPAGTPEGDYFFQTQIPLAGWLSDFADSAPVDGQGIGYISVVPEPATALLLIGGLALLRRRRA